MGEEIGGVPLVIDTMPVGTAQDGWDLTSGTTGDAAYTGSGPATKIALLKALYAKGGAVTEADGANVALGSRADAAWGGSGSGTLIAIAKALWTALTAATPAGTNSIGTVGLNAGSNAIGSVSVSNLPATQAVAGTVTANLGTLNGAAQDGADPSSPVVANKGSGIRGWLATIAGLLQLGTQTKANSASMTVASDLANLEPGGTAISATAMPAGGTGLTGWLSAVYYAVTQVLGVKAAAGAYADGAITALGSTTDAPLAAAASTASVSQGSVLKGLFNLFLNGTAKFQTCVWWIEGNNAAVTASGGATPSVTGTARASGASQGTASPFAYFLVSCYSSVAGTVSIYNNSLSGGSQVASSPVSAGATVTLKVPALGTSFTSQFTNTSTSAGNVSLSNGFVPA